MLVVLCIRAWLLSDDLSELALPIVFSATPPLLQSMACIGETSVKFWSHCYRAWLSSEQRSELALPIVFSATATKHGCSLIPTVIRQS